MVETIPFENSGALHLPDLIKPNLEHWIRACAPYFALEKPGHRILCSTALSALVHQLLTESQLQVSLGIGWQCVRAIALNKSATSNWVLGWHQDRTIAVEEQANVEGFRIWSNKHGIPHVEPPFSLLERMMTLRLHLDPVDSANAPLMVAAGSHKMGKILEHQIESVVQNSHIFECHAEAGDAWLYSTPILHASERSTTNHSRRVIQLDFSRDSLPLGLRWAGIV